MNKNIGSRVSWRTTFAVAAVALASVFTAWGDVTEITTSYLNWSIAPVWSGVAATGAVDGWSTATLFFLNAEGGEITTSDITGLTASNSDGTAGNSAIDITTLTSTSASIDSYYIQIYDSGNTIVASTSPAKWSSLTPSSITRDYSSYGLKLIDNYYTITASSVAPEPTSGLLLLLGVAGLALKRRRQVA